MENIEELGYVNDDDLYYAAESGHIKKVEILVSKGADMYYQHGTMGDMAFHCAASENHLDCVRFFLDQGFNVNSGNKQGYTALHFAAIKGHQELISFLISEGADYNLSTNDGSLPLHFAASSGNVECVKSLIESGADVRKETGRGMTALQLAIINNQPLCSIQLLEQCSKEDWGNALKAACYYANNEMVEMLKAKLEQITLDREIETDFESDKDMYF